MPRSTRIRALLIDRIYLLLDNAISHLERPEDTSVVRYSTLARALEAYLFSKSELGGRGRKSNSGTAVM